MPRFQSKILAQQMCADIQQIIDTARKEYLPLQEKQLNWKYDVKKWSIAECLAHLLLVNEPYLKQMQQVLDKKGNGAQPEFYRSGIFGEYFIGVIGPTPDGEIRMKMQTAKWYNPSTQSEIEAGVVERFIDQMEAFLHIAQQSLKVKWAKHRIKTVFGALVKFRYADALRFVIAHTQRHILQAQRVKERDHFAQY